MDTIALLKTCAVLLSGYSIMVGLVQLLPVIDSYEPYYSTRKNLNAERILFVIGCLAILTTEIHYIYLLARGN